MLSIFIHYLYSAFLKRAKICSAPQITSFGVMLISQNVENQWNIIQKAEKLSTFSQKAEMRS